MSAAPTIVVEPMFVAEGENVLVDATTIGPQRPASAAPLQGGGFVATWVTNPPGGASPNNRVVA